MKITSIKIRKFFAEGTMRAILSVTFDDELVIHDIKIIQPRGKCFLVMPVHKDKTNAYRDIVHPVNSDFRNYLENVVLHAVNRAVAEFDTEQTIEPLPVEAPLSYSLDGIQVDCSQAVISHFSGSSEDSTDTDF
ncbi:MAG: SpoVG family protein [Clostridia bacterium]|nr:SpoVG family protein [Clostridia bacterium]